MNIEIILIVLLISIKNYINGKSKRITFKRTIIVPLLLLYAIIEKIIGYKNISINDIFIFIIFIIVGILVGYFRNKKNVYELNENGKIYYKVSLSNLIILTSYIVLSLSIKLIFKTYDNKLLNLVSMSLLCISAGSISTSKLMIFFKGYKIYKTKK